MGVSMHWDGSRPTLPGYISRLHTTGRPTIMICAFEGWNDAGSAASDAVRMLLDTSQPQYLGTVGDDEFYDYQFSRPQVRREADRRVIDWPQTDLYRIALPEQPADLLITIGVEPTYRWKAFCQQLLHLAAEQRVAACVTVGALMADVPHTRPVPTHLHSENPQVQQEFGMTASAYEGPTGIPGVLGLLLDQQEIPTISLWAQQPHYVSQAPSPKVQLAIVEALEELLGTVFPAEELRDDALAWQRGVDELAGADANVARYVRQLEQASDASGLSDASGETIAREFERYLKRREPGSDEPGPTYDI